MSLSAICPNCNVANEPTNLQCTICKTALGAMLVSDAKDGFRWFVVSAFVSLGTYLTCMVLGLHMMTVIVAVFYGPLIASFYARSNVVWASAMGGMTMLAFVMFFVLVDKQAHTARRMIALVEDADPDALADTTKLLWGMVISLFIALPVALTGASVGEHLSVRRRRKPTQTA